TGTVRENAFFSASMCNNGVNASAAGSGSFAECPVCTNSSCQTATCDSSSGQCMSTPVADSTPCADTDGNACTTAGCETGACVQTHQQTVCTQDQCNVGCNMTTGQCSPAQPST